MISAYLALSFGKDQEKLNSKLSGFGRSRSSPKAVNSEGMKNWVKTERRACLRRREHYLNVQLSHQSTRTFQQTISFLK